MCFFGWRGCTSISHPSCRYQFPNDEIRIERGIRSQRLVLPRKSEVPLFFTHDLLEKAARLQLHPLYLAIGTINGPSLGMLKSLVHHPRDLPTLRQEKMGKVAQTFCAQGKKWRFNKIWSLRVYICIKKDVRELMYIINHIYIYIDRYIHTCWWIIMYIHTKNVCKYAHVNKF